ncbi:Uncharacterized protein Rs2_29159 [Raphanus sativus]|nr:Uncharacterized protein Rs2_29159 [Raphanus sativus]
MAEASESERRADSSSSTSSSPPSRHGKHMQDPLTPAPLSFVSSGSPQVGPASTVREDELRDWRKKYLLPSSVFLRIPRSSERASGGMPEEIAIYEAFFESGFRGDVLSLISLFDLQSFSFPEGTHSAPIEGEDNVLQARKLPLERRRVTHLLSLQVLRRSKLWGTREEGPDDPIIAFKKATYVISARMDSSSRNASGDRTTTARNKRKMIRRSDDSSLSQGGKTRERALSLDKDPSGIIQQVQGELLQLSEQYSRRVAKELELRDLQARIRAIQGSVETASAESLQLSREKQELEETIVELRAEAETSKNMMTMVVNGARIVARWEVMREWLKGQAHKWNLSKEFSQYKTVVLAEAEFKGTDPPSFEYEPAIPSSRRGRS